jgi:AcrR family transcriptional regulator
VANRGTETRERVLQAAGEVFAERGFKAATVREICRQADTGLAAVNYYFGSKEKLYLAVLEDRVTQRFRAFPLDAGLPPDPSPEQRLHAFIRALLFRLLGDEGLLGSSAGRLLARELVEPSPAMDHLIREHLRPQRNALRRIIQELLGDGADEADLARCMESVVAQCRHYALVAPLAGRLNVEPVRDPDAIEGLAEHIHTFSLAGIRRVGQRGTQT